MFRTSGEQGFVIAWAITKQMNSVWVIMHGVNKDTGLSSETGLSWCCTDCLASCRHAQLGHWVTSTDSKDNNSQV